MFFGSTIFSLRYTVPISGLWMWFVVFVLQVWIIIEKETFLFSPFCCKAPDRHLFFNKNLIFLQPCSVAVSSLFFFPPSASCDCPLLPHFESNGTVQPGRTRAAWPVPSWGFFSFFLTKEGMEEGESWSGNEALCVVRQSVTSLSDLVRDKASARPEVWQFVCSVSTGCRKNRQFTLLLLLYLTHNCCSVPHCFPSAFNQNCPAAPTSHLPSPPLHSGQSQGEVSQSVFLYEFKYCILLLLFKLPLV